MFLISSPSSGGKGCFPRKEIAPTGELSSRTGTIHFVNQKNNQLHLIVSEKYKEAQKIKKINAQLSKIDDGRNVPFRSINTKNINQPRRVKHNLPYWCHHRTFVLPLSWRLKYGRATRRSLAPWKGCNSLGQYAMASGRNCKILKFCDASLFDSYR